MFFRVLVSSLAELEQVYASPSWKVTAPLRRLASTSVGRGDSRSPICSAAQLDADATKRSSFQLDCDAIEPLASQQGAGLVYVLFSLVGTGPHPMVRLAVDRDLLYSGVNP